MCENPLIWVNRVIGNNLHFPFNLQTVFTLENGNLVQKQNWDGKETTIEREVTGDGKLIAVRNRFFNILFKKKLLHNSLHVSNNFCILQITIKLFMILESNLTKLCITIKLKCCR